MAVDAGSVEVGDERMWEARVVGVMKGRGAGIVVCFV